MAAQEGEETTLRVHLVADLLQQRVRDVGGDERRGVEDVNVSVLGLRHELPLVIAEVVAKGRCLRVRALVVLQHERVGKLAGCLERARHRRLLVELERDGGVFGVEVLDAARLVRLGILVVHHVLDEGIRVCQVGSHVVDASGAAHAPDLLEGFFPVGIRHEGERRGEHGVHGVVLGMRLDVDVRYGQHAAREELGCGDGALLAVGVEADRTFFGPVVLRNEAFGLEPLADVLARHGLQRSSAHGELAGVGRPVDPRVRGRQVEGRSGGRQRRTDVVAAQDDNLLELVVVAGLVEVERGGLRLGRGACLARLGGFGRLRLSACSALG